MVGRLLKGLHALIQGYRFFWAGKSHVRSGRSRFAPNALPQLQRHGPRWVPGLSEEATVAVIQFRLELRHSYASYMYMYILAGFSKWGGTERPRDV